MTLRALDGFVIGITADRRSSEQAELLQRRGAGVLHGPTMKTEYLANDELLRSATHSVIAARPAYLVATTGIGIRAWFDAAQAWGLGESLLDALADTRVVARGPKAAAAAHTAGLSVWACPPSERLDDVLVAVQAEPLAGRTVAFQHYGERNDGAVRALTGAGATVIDVPIYRWQLPPDDGPVLRLIDAVCTGQLDAVTFTSAPAAQNLVGIAREHGRDQELLGALGSDAVIAACIGPVCAEGARRAGIADVVVPTHGRLGLLVRAVTDALQSRRHVLEMAGQMVVVQGRALAVGGRRADLPDRERAVLEALLRRPGAVVPRATMLRLLGDETTDRSLEAAVGRLRRRLGAAGDAVRVVRGRGYAIDAVPAGAAVSG